MPDRLALVGFVLGSWLGFVAVGCTGDTGTDDTGIPPNEGWADDPLWDLDAPPTFRVSVPVEDWEGALWDLLPSDDCDRREYLEGEVTFVNPVDGSEESWDQVGMRWRGHSALDIDEFSRVGVKLSFNEFVPGREFYDLRKVNLLGTEGDYSAMREHLALRVSRDLGIQAPRSTYAHLFINDVYMGFYPMTEEADDEPYLKNHFADASGSLLKVEGYCGGRGDFAYEGPDSDDYLETYEPKGETLDTAIQDDLLPLIECVNGMADEAFEACIVDRVDVENWLLEIAIDVVLPDVDGMIGAGHNFMIYREPETGLFIIWPWDKDLALDEANLDPGWDLGGLHPFWASDFESLLGVQLLETFREDYCAQVLEVAERYDPAVLLPELEEHRELLAPWIEADPWLDSERWGWITDDVVEVIETRHPDIVDRAQACDF